MEQWASIYGFPNYLVSDRGLVIHERKGRELTRFTNNSGVVYVGLTLGERTYNRSVPLLVANAFLEDPPFETFNGVINLNGDRLDNRAENLRWRPYWFVRKYFQQFKQPPKGFKVPVIELDSGLRFPNSWTAAITYGLLDFDILTRTLNHQRVFPTNQLFEPIWRNTPYRTV